VAEGRRAVSAGGVITSGRLNAASGAALISALTAAAAGDVSDGVGVSAAGTGAATASGAVTMAFAAGLGAAELAGAIAGDVLRVGAMAGVDEIGAGFAAGAGVALASAGAFAAAGLGFAFALARSCCANPAVQTPRPRTAERPKPLYFFNIIYFQTSSHEHFAALIRDASAATILYQLAQLPYADVETIA